MNADKLIELLRKFLFGKATEYEKKKIDEWYDSIDQAHVQQADEQKDPGEIKIEIYKKIQAELGIENDKKAERPVVPFYKRFSLTAAAVLVLAVSATVFFIAESRPAKNLASQNQLAKTGNDVKPPVRNKAVLKLADGSEIQLDTASAGTLAVQGNIQITKQVDGRISYEGHKGDSLSYNTLSVPKGSTPVKLLLADGSEVWLNVASSITYPTSFTGHERKVEISGEAYFEVAKNAAMPFIVKRKEDDLVIQVLGTHFNVNAYQDEAAVYVTLLEGSVDVSKGENHQIIKPGQQAIWNNQLLSVANNADLDQVMAWKNGRFYFEGADMKSIMRQVEKWYDVEVEYSAEIPHSFVAKISRNVNVSELLNIFSLTDLVHFNIVNNKITVMK